MSPSKSKDQDEQDDRTAEERVNTWLGYLKDENGRYKSGVSHAPIISLSLSHFLNLSLAYILSALSTTITLLLNLRY